MYLQFIRYIGSIYGSVYRIGETIEYKPWPYDWQGMPEPDRVAAGIFVHCHGMGEFEVFTKMDVRPVCGYEVDKPIPIDSQKWYRIGGAMILGIDLINAGVSFKSLKEPQ